MSTAYYIVVDADPPPFDSAVNGQALARSALRLSAAANAQGVTPLLDFYSTSASDLADARDLGLPADRVRSAGKERWFQADAGLRTIHELLQLPEREMQELGKGVREDLVDFARVLQLVKQSGLRWHLGIDR